MFNKLISSTNRYAIIIMLLDGRITCFGCAQNVVHLLICPYKTVFVCFLSFSCHCRSREKSTVTSFSKRKLRLLLLP